MESDRRLELLELMGREGMGQNMRPEVLNQEVVNMKQMYAMMVEEVWNEEIKELNSETV